MLEVEELPELPESGSQSGSESVVELMVESSQRKELWAFRSFDLSQLRETFQVPDGVLLHSGEELEVIQDISQLQALCQYVLQMTVNFTN